MPSLGSRTSSPVIVRSRVLVLFAQSMAWNTRKMNKTVLGIEMIYVHSLCGLKHGENCDEDRKLPPFSARSSLAHLLHRLSELNMNSDFLLYLILGVNPMIHFSTHIRYLIWFMRSIWFHVHSITLFAVLFLSPYSNFTWSHVTFLCRKLEMYHVSYHSLKSVKWTFIYTMMWDTCTGTTCSASPGKLVTEYPITI